MATTAPTPGITKARGFTAARVRGVSPRLAGQLVPFLCLALVVLDSPLGVVGRAVGFGLALGGAIVALRLSSSGRVWRSLGEVVGGSTGVVVGLGYGGQRLAEGSLSLAVPAIGAAIASMALLLIGIYHAVRAAPGWWRLLALPVTFVMLQFVLIRVRKQREHETKYEPTTRSQVSN